jgi:hypothetical protein
MNIEQLESYSLADAVKFHNKLNPKLWGKDEHLLPEVRNKLLEIAEEFKEYLGVSDLNIVDITISGSNAAFSYTPHSDIDLHLVVQKPTGSNEVYQELFNAKKYAFNDMHDIRIHGADVELYVQDAESSPVSLGEYSIKNGDWIQIPKKKRAKIDQSVVRHKYEDLVARIDSALKSNDADHIAALLTKIKTMRQTGLDQHGEFGPENLAFKILRKQGYIQKLYDAQAAARDRELSLQERNRPRQPVRYGFGEGDTGMAQGSSIGDAGAQSTWDGVSPDTDQTLTEDNIESVVSKFFKKTINFLGIKNPPKIVFHHDTDWSKNSGSFGQYNPDDNLLHLATSGRHTLDILRTMSHELTHCKQNEKDRLPDNAGETGSWWEDEANAMAGRIMRYWADEHPEMFSDVPLEESSGYIPTRTQARDPRFKMALTVDVKPGQTGQEANKLALKTDSQGRPALLIKGLKNALREFKETGRLPKSVKEMDQFGNQDVTGPESKPTMPAGTVRVDVSDVYDWYKLGQHISNMKGLGKHDFGQGAPSAILSFGDEETEHKYIKDLEKTGLTTTDIDPVDPDQPPGMKRQKVDPTYNVDESFGIETYPIPLPIGDYLGPDSDEFAPPGNYKDSGDLHEEVWDLMDAGVVPKVVVAYPKSLLATQDWLSNEGGSEPLFPEYPDRPVVYKKAGKNYILDGHHRITKAFKAGSPISVYLFRDSDLKENFADGKNPQDKGDSARHGIPKKASISSLRKIAKQGGRKGQLAHWQANMRSGRAKANETIAESEQLLEINMSPSSLRTLAAQTGAIAGMEFEMIVPGIDAGNEDGEQEPDYEPDEPAYDIQSIVNFFYDDDYNGRREIERLRGRMESEYQDWVSESVGNAWESEGRDILREYIENNEFDRDDALDTAVDEIKRANPDLAPESEEFTALVSARVEEMLDALTEEAWEEQDRTYDRAFEEYSDEQRDDFGENDWLEAEGIAYMSDVERQYEIMWPHWTSEDSDGAGIESVADDFASAIGRKTNWSATYHGGAREPNAYVVEPDGSLVPGDDDDAGLEFVSPPLPIDDMLSDLNKVKAWADERGCYTSKAAKTGLHINVSVPNFDAKKLDYVKLALLLGDQYVLEQFGRTGNQYAKSALDIVKTRVQERPGDAALLLNKMRDNLEALATKVIHTGDTSKFTSINTKTGYVEFRSPGGDWLDENFDKIENTLLRFVVALDAAMDPQKYRDEYLKKLYKLLNPAGQKDAYGDMVQEFSRYMVYLEQRSTDAPGKLSPEAQQAIKEFRRAAAAELAQTTAAPAGAAANYKIYSIPDGRIMDTFYAANQAAAEDQFRDWLMTPEAGASDNFRYAPMGTIIRGETGSAAATPATNTLTPLGPGPWEIYRISDNSSVREIGHTNRAAAETEARSALGLRGEAPELYGVRTRPGADAASNGIIDIEPDIEQYTVPGSTLDLQRQRQQAAQQPAATGTFRGTWAIKDSRGNTLHTFSGIGNSQSDANRVAAGWLARAGYQQGLEVEVVPVMEPQ